MSIKLTGKETIKPTLPITDAASERNAWSLQLRALNSSVVDPEAWLAQVTPKLNGVPYGSPMWSSKYENPLVLSVEGGQIIGTQEALAPPPVDPGPTPAPSDAWTQVPAGTIITEDGKSYEVRDTPFGKMKFLVRATLATPSLATERAAYVEYIKSRLTETADLEAQAELLVLLTWLSKRA